MDSDMDNKENAISRLMRRREFAYSHVFCHPPLATPAFSDSGDIKADIPAEVATLCKNESNCTVFLPEGTWFTTWGQGSFEHAKDERIVFSTSSNQGRTWTPPRTIVASTPAERRAYGAPFVVPGLGRIVIFFFGCNQEAPWNSLEHNAGNLFYVWSDDAGAKWSDSIRINLPMRDIDSFANRFHGWINHPPHIMPTGEVILPLNHHSWNLVRRGAWQIARAETSVLCLDNILTEQDPSRFSFTLLPAGPRGIRVNPLRHADNPSLLQLLQAFNGLPEESGPNFQEMTVIPFCNDRWLGVGRTFLGSPGYTISQDRGVTWTVAEPLRYAPNREFIRHPMTMCPIAKTSDGRIVLLFTNNDGSQRGAKHVWDGNGRTRNPQWFVVGREIPGETDNAGLVFGKPRILAEVDDSGEANLKTGISMPHFFERKGRFFVCYNINKEHILLDEIPTSVIDEMTPGIK